MRVTVAALPALVGALVFGQNTDENMKWQMAPVRTIQARVQNSPPAWNAQMGRWVGDFGPLSDPYVSPMDSVTTSSVEGALLYLQTKIPYNGKDYCTRPSNMSYIWIYDITFAQPNGSVATYGSLTSEIPEYGHYVDMASGSCEIEGGTTPGECLEVAGKSLRPLGPYVGARFERNRDYGDYNDTLWFSYPNSCVDKKYALKTEECRAKQPGGLCPIGVKPDGVKCTYAYNILGHIRIDDLVGITNMTWKNDSTRYYKNRVELCTDGRKEYIFSGSVAESDVEFWKDGLNRIANVERSRKLLEFYSSNRDVNMLPLPTISELTSENPPCWVNNPRCGQSQYGCRRSLLAQICVICTDATTAGCVAKPDNATIVYPSFTAPESPSAPVETSPVDTSSSLGAGAIVGIIVGVLALIAIVYFVARRRPDNRDDYTYKNDPTSYMAETSMETMSFDMQDLALIRLEESNLSYIKVLGSGTFADVWLGTFENDQVAIKKMHPNKVNLRHIQSFVEEIKLMSGFDSPYLVHCIGACWTRPSDLTCVMEFMDSSDLRTQLETTTPQTLSWPHKFAFIQNISGGLSYLHSYNVIHRDLKSRNLLVDSQKGLKITDFGISREDLQATMTVGVGTFRWMAPEVIQGHQYSVAADIYSFGMILSELDTHCIPYHSLKNEATGQMMTDTAIILAVGQGTIRPTFSSTCPDWVRDLALSCIAHDQDDRPTANEIAQIIRNNLRRTQD